MQMNITSFHSQDHDFSPCAYTNLRGSLTFDKCDNTGEPVGQKNYLSLHN